jgi:hypothetical protein
MDVRSPQTLLSIDECEEWIWDILDSNKDSGFEYLVDDEKEFLIFNTNTNILYSTGWLHR